MFTHLLVPISGEEMDQKTMKNIAKFAWTDTAKITFVYVSNPNPPYMYSDEAFGYGISQTNHKKSCDEYASQLFKKAIAQIGTGVVANSCHIFNTSIYEGILDVAKKSKNDVIVMASHKRTGLRGWMIGSETHAVIQHSKLPVLVI